VRAARKLISRAQAALRAGDSKTAEELFDQALARNPRFTEAAWEKARLATAAGRYDEALEALDATLATQKTKSHSLLQQKALTLYAKGDYGGALSVTEEILVLAANSRAMVTRYLRAKAFAQQQDKESTLAALHDAIEDGYKDFAELERDTKDVFAFLDGEPRFDSMVEDVRQRAAEVAIAPDDDFVGVAIAESLPLDAGRGYKTEALVTQIAWNNEKGKARPLPTATDLFGTPIDWQKHQGKAVVLFVWGPWSETSLRQLPACQNFFDQHKGKIDIVGLAVMARTETDVAQVTLDAVLTKHGITFPQAIIDQATARLLGVDRFSSTLFVGKDGRVYLNAPGSIDLTAMETLIQETAEVSERATGPIGPAGPLDPYHPRSAGPNPSDESSDSQSSDSQPTE